MAKDYNELTAIEVDAGLRYDEIKDDELVFKRVSIVIIILIFFFRGFIGYWLKFGIAIPNAYSFNGISTENEPIQTDYTAEEQKNKTFTYKSLINKNTIELIPQAHYELSGMVVATNHDFVFTNNFFDSASLFDLGASWGKLANKDLYKRYFKIYNTKIEFTGARQLYWQWRYDTPFSAEYISGHLSHSHIIPANRNIMAAMLRLKKFQKFKIEGELVDMNYFDKNRGKIIKYYTSLSRYDNDGSSRGSGSCETIFVTKVQIGSKIYQ